MAVKRIGFIEENIEKIVVGVAGAGLLGVLVYQFVGPKAEVMVPSGSGPGKIAVPVAEAWPRVDNEAKKLKGDMDGAKADPEIKIAGGDDIAKSFRNTHNAPVSRNRTMVSVKGSTPDRPDNVPVVAMDTWHVPTIPALARPVAAAFLSTVDKSEVDAAPDLAKLLPAAMPFDMPGVTIETSISGDALTAAFQVDPEGAAKALPPIWWENTTAAFHVEAVREELQPDGSWSKGVVVAPMPGRFSMLADLNKGLVSAESMAKVIDNALASETEVLRPEWYQRPIWAGNAVGAEWRPPSESTTAALETGASDLKKDVRELADVRRRIPALQKQLDAARAQRTGGGGGGGGRNPVAPPTNNDAARRLIDRLQAQLDALVEKEKALADKLAKAGQKPVRAPSSAAAGSTLFAPGTTTMWVHDVTAQRGKTYRYQLSVWLSNPLFGRVLDQTQKEMATRPVLKGAASEWSNPVTVDDTTMYFITSASDGQSNKKSVPSTGARASAELYTFWWGYWRQGKISLDPGDMLIVEKDVPDFSKLMTMAMPAGTTPGAPGATPPPERRDEGPGGGKRTAPNIPAPPTAPPAPGEKPAGPVLDAKLIPKTKLVIKRDAFLLDVATVVEAQGKSVAGDQFQAYLRESNGLVHSRRPDADNAEKKLKELRDSAQAGENFLSLGAGDSEIKDNKPKPTKPEDPPPGGGGGGGGGG